MRPGLIPSALGGTSQSLLDAAIALEEQFAADASITITIASVGLGLMPLVMGGTSEQHTKFLAPFLSGEGIPLASMVHSEPGGTANWLEKGSVGLRTTATKNGGEWIINGEKVSNDQLGNSCREARC